MNVNLALTRLRARAPKGQRAHGKRPQKRGQNVSVVGALSLTGLLTSISIMGAWLYRVDYAADVGKCQLIKQRNRNRSKFLNP